MHSLRVQRLLALLVAVVLASQAPLSAQEDESSIDVNWDELRAPYSPAFTLLGVAPTSIERPSAPREFWASITSTLDGGTRDVPTDLAIEFAPYWWFDHADLAYDDYRQRDLWSRILQTASVSIASTEIPARDSAPGLTGARLGFGVRFQLLEGRAPTAIGEGLEELENRLRDAQLLFLDADTLEELRVEEARLLLALGDESVAPEDRQALTTDLAQLQATMAQMELRLRAAGVDTDNLGQERDRAQARLTERARALRDVDRQRVGWVAEFASAAAADFPEGEAGSGQFTRGAGWFTLSYTPEARDEDDSDERVARASAFTGLALGRVQWEDVDGADDQSYDLGGRLIWRAPASPLSLSAEYLHRFAEGRSDTDRWAVVSEYQINDDYTIVASFGSNFDTEFEGDSDLIASIGVSLGYGSGPSRQFRF